MRRPLLTLAVCLIAAAGLRAEDPPAAPPPALKLTIPAGWQDRSKPPSPDKPGPVNIVLATREKEGIFSVQIVFVRAPNQPDAFDDDTLKKLLDAAAKPLLEGSDQKEVKPQPLDGPKVHGFFATLTAKNAKPGESACVTLAHVRLGDGLLAATVRHPDGSPNLPKALEMIKTASLGAPATKPATQPVGKPLAKPPAKPTAKPSGTHLRPTPAR